MNCIVRRAQNFITYSLQTHIYSIITTNYCLFLCFFQQKNPSDCNFTLFVNFNALTQITVLQERCFWKLLICMYCMMQPLSSHICCKLRAHQGIEPGIVHTQNRNHTPKRVTFPHVSHTEFLPHVFCMSIQVRNTPMKSLPQLTTMTT